MNKNFVLKDKYFLILLAFLFLIAGALFFDFIINKRLYIFNDAGSDTEASYWPVYKFIVESIKDGTLKNWSMQIGMGTSTFTLYSFLFDPFTLVLLIFPVRLLAYGILVAAIFKIVLSGCLFYFYINLFSVKRFVAVMASLIWAFNGYMMLWGQHYWFATMVVLFTFIMFGLEVWLRKGKPVLFSVSIALMGINSPYFLFMISLFIFFYTVFHILLEKNRFAFTKAFSKIVRFFVFYFIGLGASAVAFLPVCYLLLSSPRTSGAYFNGELFYLADTQTYVSMFLRFFSNNAMGPILNYFGTLNFFEGPMLSSSLLFFLALPQLFFLKESMRKKILYLAVGLLYLLILIDPFFTTLFNAFSSYNYRWNFIIVFLNVLVIGWVIQKISDEKRVSIAGIIVSALIVVGGWYICNKLMIKNAMIPSNLLETGYLKRLAMWVGTFLILYTMCLFAIRSNKKIVWLVFLLTVSAELFRFNYPTINHRITVSPSESTDRLGYFDHSNEAINYVKNLDKGLYRIDKNYVSYFFNDSLFQNFNGVKSYNSLNNPGYISFLETLNTGMTNPNLGSGFNPRGILRDLTGVKYVLSKDEIVPIGYQKIKTFNDVNLYQNPNALPVFFAYNSYMKASEFNQLTTLEKEQALLNAIVVDHSVPLKHYSIQKSKDKAEPLEIRNFQMENGEMKADRQLENFEVDSASGDPRLVIPVPESEAGWRIEFEVVGSAATNGQIYWSKGNKSFTPVQSYTFAVNTTPVKQAFDLDGKSIRKLRFDPGDSAGTYTIKNFRIVKIDPKQTEKAVNRLVASHPKLMAYSNNYLKGQLENNQDSMLFVSFPYDKGWELKIDGKTAAVQKANVGFIGAIIPKGTHTFELQYHQPLLKSGLFISIFCWGIILFFSLGRKRSKKEQKAE